MQTKLSVLMALFASTQAKGKCPFGYDKADNDTELVQTKNYDYQYPSQMFEEGVTTTPSSFSAHNYKKIVLAVDAEYDAIDDTVSDNSNPRGAFVGCLLRMAGHDFMDFRYEDDGTTTGGSDGCINFEDPDNKGLPECLEKFNMPAVYSQFKEDVSLADFFVIAAEAAMGRTATDYNSKYRFATSSLANKFREGFKAGRSTVNECPFEGRMPNPEHGCNGRGEGKDGLKQIFVDHIYKDAEFPWALTAAISGAHTVGSAKPENSGYDGHWSSSEEQGKFNNNYFRRLILNSWGPERAVGGDDNKNQWQLADEGSDAFTHKEMMLTTDMCLVYNYQPTHQECYDKDDTLSTFDYREQCLQNHQHGGPNWKHKETVQGFEDLDPTKHFCCAWMRVHVPTSAGVVPKEPGQFSEFGVTAQFDSCGMQMDRDASGGHKNEPEDLSRCCPNKPSGGKSGESFSKMCDTLYNPAGYAAWDVIDFARDETIFYRWFKSAWWIATENGNGDEVSCMMSSQCASRDDLTDEEAYVCPTTTDDMTTEDEKYCAMLRFGDSNIHFVDYGANSVRNWYSLSRTALPKELRDEGYDVWNWLEHYELTFNKAESSSTGTATWNGAQANHPAKYLLRASRFYSNLEAGKNPSPRFNYLDRTHNGKGSTCWASQAESDAKVSLTLKNGEEEIYRVALMYRRFAYADNLKGAIIELEREENGETITEYCGEMDTKNEPTKYAKPMPVLCEKAVQADGTERYPKGTKVVVRWPEGTSAKQLIVCGVMAYKYDQWAENLLERTLGNWL